MRICHEVMHSLNSDDADNNECDDADNNEGDDAEVAPPRHRRMTDITSTEMPTPFVCS